MQIKYLLSIIAATSVATAKSAASSTVPTTLSTSTLSSSSSSSSSSSASSSSSSSASSSSSSASASATPSAFSVIAIHSGSEVQNDPIKKVQSHLHVLSVGGDEGDDVTWSFKDGKNLIDKDGEYVGVDSSTGEVGQYDSSEKLPSFEIKDGSLVIKDYDSFYACPSGPDKYSLTVKSCDGGIGLDLQVV